MQLAQVGFVHMYNLVRIPLVSGKKLRIQKGKKLLEMVTYRFGPVSVCPVSKTPVAGAPNNNSLVI